jgi:tRNA(Ile)-lysidine synthase
MINSLKQYIEDHQITSVLLGLSGGLDSHVLLHLLSQLENLETRVIYVNHGLHKDNDDWETHCQQQCDNLQRPLMIERLNLKPKPGDSLEAVARAARYDAFAKHLNPGQHLITAHHEDDQAETALLQLFRGAGIKGLSAMPASKIFKNGFHTRPLLGETRDTILAYAQKHHLQWVEDQSNLDTQHDRNFLRHDILPTLKKRWPALSKTISRSASHLANDATLLNDYLEKDLEKQGFNANISAPITHLLSLSEAKCTALLRTWITQCNHPTPSTAMMQSLYHDVLLATADANPEMLWQKTVLRRYQDRLYLMTKRETPPNTNLRNWSLDQPITLDYATLDPEKLYQLGLARTISAVEIRYRQGGERLKKPGATHSQCLKQYFQAEQIPPWERELTPLIYHNGVLIAVGDKLKKTA